MSPVAERDVKHGHILCIECVNYDENKRICSVGWRIAFRDGRYSDRYPKERKDVVDALTEGKIIRTRYKENGDLKIGAKVDTIKIGNETYIRTDKNKIPEDNLENLGDC